MKLNSGETPHTLILHDDYLQTLRQSKAVTIADLGCGFGRYAHFLSKEIGAIVTGFDINPKEIELAKSLAKRNANEKVIFEEGDVTDLLPLSMLHQPKKVIISENMFDSAILVGTIGVVEEEIRQKMLEQAFQIVRPGGTVAVAEYAVNPDQKAKYEEDEKITGEKYSRVVRDPNGEILWIATHFTKDDLTERLRRIGLSSIQIREALVTSEVVKGAGKKTRLQYTAWGIKPTPTKHVDRQKVKAELAGINFADIESKKPKSTIADLAKIESLIKDQKAEQARENN